MHNEDELKVIVDFAVDTWKDSKDTDDGYDFDGLFDGLDISLN